MTTLRRYPVGSKALRHFLLGMVLAVSMSPAARAEIAARPPGGISPIPEGKQLRTECWQEGIKIFEAEGYTGLDLDTLAQSKSLRLSKPGQQRNALVVVPLDHAVCFVESED